MEEHTYVTENVIANEFNRYFIDSIRNIVDSTSVMYDVNEGTENGNKQSECNERSCYLPIHIHTRTLTHRHVQFGQHARTHTAMNHSAPHTQISKIIKIAQAR